MGISTRQERQSTPTNIEDSSRSNNINKSCNRQCHQLIKGKGKVHWDWEKDFCRMNGIAWQLVLDAKKYLRVCPRLANWNDSAGREAFRNAKARYWAQINGVEVDPPLPDPELYNNSEASMSEIEMDLHENFKGSISDDEYDDDDDRSWGDGGVILLDEHYQKLIPHDINDDTPVVATGWVVEE